MDQFIYIGAALVIALLIGFISLSISWLNKTMLRNVRSHTLELLSVYDTLLEEKSRELTDAAEKAQARKKEHKSPASTPMVKDTQDITPSTLFAVADRSAEASYRDPAIGVTYRQIRKNFSFQIQELLPAMASHTEETGGPAGRLLEALDYSTIYRLSTLTEEEQLQVLSASLPGEGISLLNTYMELHPRFSIFGFYDALKSWEAEEPQPARLYVPEGFAIPNGSSVQISADQDICEGFQAEIGGKLYDYSLKTKELS